MLLQMRTSMLSLANVHTVQKVYYLPQQRLYCMQQILDRSLYVRVVVLYY